MRIVALLLLPFLVLGQNKNALVRGRDQIAIKSIEKPFQSDFFRTTIAVPDGNANVFVRTPYNVNNPPIGGWPVVFFLGGDGTSGNNTNVLTGQAMSTSDDLTYTHTRTASLFRLMTGSVRILRNGFEVARSKAGGTIIGPGGITGSITNFNTNDPNTNTTPTISVTFPTSQAGNTITYNMVESTMITEGLPRFLNLGDSLDGRCIVIAIQNINSTNDLERAYFDNMVTYVWNNFSVNPKRFYTAAISRGGRQTIEQMADGANTSLIKTRNQFWIDVKLGTVFTSAAAGRVEAGIASIVTGTAGYGGTFTVANITDMGGLHVHATADATLSNTLPTYTATLSTANEPPYTLNWPGPFVGPSHSWELWDDQLYNRLYRNGGTGTALMDYADFLLKYSKDPLERASLFVEQAEKRRYNTEKDIIDYRHAARQVASLSAGYQKTELENRLATLKAAIDGAGQRWVINFHSSGQAAGGNYVDIATDANSTTTSNMIDFDGNSTTLDLVEVTSPAGGGMAVVGSGRRSHTGGFSLTANNSGMSLSGFPFGTFNFTDMASGTYTIRFYISNGVANFGTVQEPAVTINGVEKRMNYASINSAIGFIEFASIPHTSLTSNFTVYTYSGSPKLTMIELYKHP